MQTNEQLLAAIEHYLARIERPVEPRQLYEPIGYSLTGGGKRLRPMLTMLACGIFIDEVVAAMPAAAAIETYHNFTLLHDDIMDNSPTRRGKASVHARWGQNVAILSGDAMLIESFGLLGQSSPALLPQILAQFARTAMEVCEGQQYDMDFEQREAVTEAEYLKMIGLKTAALLAGAVTLGAIAGGASGEQCDTLGRFATELGLAFQLQDDLLDCYGDERLGKPLGGDIIEGKKSFLMITAMRLAGEAERERLRTAHLDDRLSDAQKIAAVRSIYDRLDVRRITEERIAHHFALALRSLDSLAVEPARTARMREYAVSLMGRNN